MSARRAWGAAAGLAFAIALTACGGASSDPPEGVAAGTSSTAVATDPPAAAPPSTPSETRASQTGDGERLRGLSDFPVTVTPDPSWTPVEPGPGTLSFAAADGTHAISVHAVSSLASTPEDQVPDDIGGFLQEQRADIVVSDVRSVTQSGLPAQRFRVTMSPGRSPSDLWRARSGTGYKPLATDPMEVVAVRSSEGLVFLWTEWSPEDEAAALAAFEAALPRVTVE